MTIGVRSKRKTRLAVAIGVVVATLLFWPPASNRHYVAPRTSPSFERRPTSDALVNASGAGDLGAMTKLFDSGVSPDSGKKEEDRSALSMAASAGKLSAVKLLLDRGADVNADDAWGGNALIGASVGARVDVVKFLLSRGADPNANDDGASALGYVSYQQIFHSTRVPIRDYLTVAELLQANGANTVIIDLPIVRLRSLLSRI